jgi:carboxyl-terminal processing protease
MTPFDNRSPFGANAQPNDAYSAAQAGQGVVQVIVTALLVTLAFAAGWFGNSFVNRPAYAANSDEKLILQAWDDIDQYFVVTGAIDHRKMAYAAINAMVASLGDTGHSRFDTPEQIAAENNQLNNTPTVGIGVLLSGGGSLPWRIEVIFPGSPASKSALRPGDILVAVNGTNVAGKTFDDLHNLITGKAGTVVTLTVTHPGTSAPTDVAITRGAYTTPTVEPFIIPGTHIADIHIIEFTTSADADLKKALKDALSQHVSGIILDLRDDPGGELDQAVSVASEFIPSGRGKNVLIIKSRSDQQVSAVQAGGLATRVPLVVLVNQNTASAAEIVTSAIKDNRPTVHVVGQTTVGTGTILQTILLADGSALVLGTAEWLPPNGQSVYHKGFTPDQPVALPSNVTPLDPLQIQQQGFSLQQIESSGDAQLVQALHDLGTP